MSNDGPNAASTFLHALHTYFEATDALHLDLKGDGIPEAWFLGPKAENQELLQQLIVQAINAHCESRRNYQPADPEYITKSIKDSQAYKSAVDLLKTHADALNRKLQRSAPIFSMRHHGHMLWDQVLPATVGYYSAMLYNQNNVAAEASPVTTLLEIAVGLDLCRMLGYQDDPVPWGHITCDGSVANMEALWAARNARFFALALRQAIREVPRLADAKALGVRLLDGTRARLVDLEAWTLVNLALDDIVVLPKRMQEEIGIPVADTTAALQSYSLQHIGIAEFHKRFIADMGAPVVLVPSTRHYSWPKGGALLGLGQNNVLKIRVDARARMDIAHLDEMLTRCLRTKTPVIAVVAVIGSTEESAVDPLTEILRLRKRFREEGLDFLVHCDAAWGGYFSCLLREGRARAGAGGAGALHDQAPSILAINAEAAGAASAEARSDPSLAFVEEFRRTIAEAAIAAVAGIAAAAPVFHMTDYVREQYQALKDSDTITVDPHKAGYVPYPAGALCYRNAATRELISLRAPIVHHEMTEPTIGVYGIEGSKPGAAAAAVWLAHKVIPPTRQGYGQLLGRCIWNSKRLYCRLLNMGEKERERNPPRYSLVIFQMLPAEQKGLTREEIDEERALVRDFVGLNNLKLLERLRRDERARSLFTELGSDQVILAYSFNFYREDGTLNDDVAQMNKLNDEIFKICSVTAPPENMNDKKLILTSSAFDRDSYGPAFVEAYCRRLGVNNPTDEPVSFLISTTMDPWVTDTTGGDFLEQIELALEQAVLSAREAVLGRPAHHPGP